MMEPKMIQKLTLYESVAESSASPPPPPPPPTAITAVASAATEAMPVMIVYGRPKR